ncbi:MAG: ATP-binding cassette domain-containing protein [Parvularculaceae bacterium]|nr:ATP-binding cassette domain-containing protein [Parvularculaceae bacterium]
MTATEQPKSGARALAETLETRLADGTMKPLGPAVVRTCVKPLLRALGWSGDDRFLIEAAPHMAPVDSIDEARTIAHRLGFTSTAENTAGLRAEQAPALFEDAHGTLHALLGAGPDGALQIIDNAQQTVDAAALAGPFRIARFHEVERADVELTTRDADWFRFTTSRLHQLIFVAFILSLAVNVMGLATPIFVTSVYDKVMGGHFAPTLFFLLAAILAVLHVEGKLRTLRGRVVAHIGAKFDQEISNATQARIFNMPLQKTGSASVQSQLTLLRKFEAFRDFFSGHIANTVVDLPFTTIFLAYIALTGGPLFWVPIIVTALFACVVFAYRAVLSHSIAKSGALRSQLQMLRLEILQKRTAIYELGAEEVWLKRFNALAVKAHQNKFRTQFLDNALHTTSQSMMSVAGAATLGAGAIMVMDKTITVGALVGVMIVVWRVLTPVQIMILSLSRIDQMRETVKHLNQLMKMQGEENPARPSSAARRFAGAMSVSGVSFRASPDSEPLLRGVDGEFKAGEATALAGPDAAAKSVLFKVALDLYRPQLGTIMIDGVNVLQVPRRALRASIAYQPAQAQFYYGTIAQNLRLAEPTAGDDAVYKALLDAGFSPDDPLVLQRNDLRLDFSKRETLPPRVKQMLSLARAYVKDASVYFLDEPDRFLDRRGVEALTRKITALKGRATLLVATSNLDVVRACDSAAVFVGGRIAGAGPAAEIAAKLERAAEPRQSAA